MRKLILAVMLLALMLPAYAQQVPANSLDQSDVSVQSGKKVGPGLNPEERAARYVNNLAPKLNLNEEQKRKLQETAVNSFRKEDELRLQMREQKEKMKAARKQQMDERTQQMKSILTAEQYAKWEEMKKHKAESKAARKEHNKTVPVNRK